MAGRRKWHQWTHDPSRWDLVQLTPQGTPERVVSGNWGLRYIRAPIGWSLLEQLADAGAAADPREVARINGRRRPRC